MNMLCPEYKSSVIPHLKWLMEFEAKREDKKVRQPIALVGWVLENDAGGYVSMKAKTGEEPICLFAIKESAISAKESIGGNLEVKFYGLVELKEKNEKRN